MKEMRKALFACIFSSFLLGSSDCVKAQNESWIKKETIISCMQQAKQRGIPWKYVAYVENGRAHLLTERARGGDVFICEANGRHAAPDYN